jgi:hemoglobin
MKTSAPFECRAASVGLTEALVRKVIVSFYDKVRSDALLGPIFSKAIGNGWDSHIERIVGFWLTATRLGRGYDGRKFMRAHLQNPSIHVDQLPRWLELFRATATEQCSPQAASVLIDIAERMAETLEIGLARRDARHQEFRDPE